MADETSDRTQAGLSPVLTDWVARHGALQGQPYVTDPMIKTPVIVGGKDTGETTEGPNPNPVYRYTFADGSTLEATWDGSIKQATEKTPSTSTNKPSQPGAWTPVYATPSDPSSGQIGQWDPVNSAFHPQAASAGAKPTGTYTNVIDPNDPTNKRVIGMVDKGDGSWHAVSTDSKLNKQVVNTANAVYVLNDDGSIANTIKVDKNSPFQAVLVDGKPYKFDPNTGEFTAGPVTAHPDIKDQNQLTMVWNEGEGKYVYPPGVKPAAGLSVNTAAPNLIWYDNEGNVVATRPNENYRPAAPTLPQVSTNAPMVPIEDPDKPGQIKWIPNQGRVTASAALQQLAASLTNTVVDPNNPMTVDDAKAIIDAANARMTSESQQAQTAAGAAGNILTSQQQGAQTGAGLLQQRQETTQNLIQQGLGVATSTGGRYGNYSGGMLSPVPGLGQALAGGAQAFATELGGGQAVYDTAIRMVQAADPNNQNPDRAAAVATLTQIMDRYKQSTGQDFPTVAATKALQASQQQQSFQPPATVQPVPALAMQPMGPRADQISGATPMGNALAPNAGATGTVMPGAANYLGSMPVAQAQPRSLQELGFTAPGAVMGILGPMAMARG